MHCPFEIKTNLHIKLNNALWIDAIRQFFYNHRRNVEHKMRISCFPSFEQSFLWCYLIRDGLLLMWLFIMTFVNSIVRCLLADVQNFFHRIIFDIVEFFVDYHRELNSKLISVKIDFGLVFELNYLTSFMNALANCSLILSCECNLVSLELQVYLSFYII